MLGSLTQIGRVCPLTVRSASSLSFASSASPSSSIRKSTAEMLPVQSRVKPRPSWIICSRAGCTSPLKTLALSCLGLSVVSSERCTVPFVSTKSRWKSCDLEGDLAPFASFGVESGDDFFFGALPGDAFFVCLSKARAQSW